MPDAPVDFENYYGNCPDRISGMNVTRRSSAEKSLIASSNCVSDSAISVILDLIESESTVNFDPLFFTHLHLTKHNKVIYFANAFQYQYKISLLGILLIRLRLSQVACTVPINGY